MIVTTEIDIDILHLYTYLEGFIDEYLSEEYHIDALTEESMGALLKNLGEMLIENSRAYH